MGPLSAQGFRFKPSCFLFGGLWLDQLGWTVLCFRWAVICP